MAFCKNCGAQLDENVKFCASCGAPVDGAPAGGNIAKVQTASDHTSEFDPEDIKENKLLAALCYLGTTFMIIALIAKRDSAFVKFHANQSLLLQVLAIAAVIVCIIPILGWIAALVAGVFSLVCLIIGIVNACSGNAKDLPLLGSIRIIK